MGIVIVSMLKAVTETSLCCCDHYPESEQRRYIYVYMTMYMFNSVIMHVF